MAIITQGTPIRKVLSGGTPIQKVLSQGTVIWTNIVLITITIPAITGVASQTLKIGGTTVYNGAGGTTVQVKQGRSVAITATATTGYESPTVTTPAPTMEDFSTASYITAGSIKTYTVTFDLAGGTRTGGGALVQTVSYGGSATVPTCTRTDYTFNGWSGTYTDVTSNRTITATWTASKRTNYISIQYSGSKFYVSSTYAVTSTVTVELYSVDAGIADLAFTIPSGSSSSSLKPARAATDWAKQIVLPSSDSNYYYS